MNEKIEDKNSLNQPIIEKTEIQPASAYTVIHHDGGGTKTEKDHKVHHDGGGTWDSEAER